ncbi:Transcription regulator [Penicillium herquei]|nr:Transcription regulator [Penicillium herquei]
MTTHGPLTAWLLQSTPQSLKRATTHPFLAAAGQGTLPKSILSQWLSQDRLYAQSYIRFIGQLLAKIRLDSRAANPQTHLAFSPEHQAVDVLIDALVNIRTELRFFESTAAEYDLDLAAISADEGGSALAVSDHGSIITTSAKISTTGSTSCPGHTGSTCHQDPPVSDLQGDLNSDKSVLHRLCNAQGECQMQAGSEVCSPPLETAGLRKKVVTDCEPCIQQPEYCGNPGSAEQMERGGPVYFSATRITRAYIDMFMSAGAAGVDVIEGLAVLWATEVCYLRSWKYAAGFLKARAGDDNGKEDADGGALKEKFINNWTSEEFEAFVDQIGEVLDLMATQIKGSEEGEMMRGRCLEWWRQVLWLEERFWPVMPVE